MNEPLQPEDKSRLLCGMQPAREAIRAHGARIRKVLVEKNGGEAILALARFATDQGIEVETVDRGLLDRLAKGARHQGVVVRAPELSILSEQDLEGDLLVALDELEDPQNFGAIIRSAVAMGAQGILWPEHHSAPLTPATFRASAGAVEYARLCRVRNLPKALEDLRDKAYTVVGLDAQGQSALHELTLTGPTVVVVGAEGKGLRGPVKRACTHTAKLPMPGPIASLNASVAVGMALYEVRRQRA
jgi:23S rRNA (guanosine2251-2'-O)-methyltransferase